MSTWPELCGALRVAVGHLCDVVVKAERLGLEGRDETLNDLVGAHDRVADILEQLDGLQEIQETE